MVEANGWDCILVIGAISNGFYKRGLAGILKTYNRDLELFAEKLALDPIENFINKSHHFSIYINYFSSGGLLLKIR